MPDRAKTDRDDFIGPKPSALVRRFFEWALPRLLPRLGVVGVVYEPSDLERLRALAPYTVLLTPNHPTNTEPALLFHLSAAVQQPFYYLACREAFEPLWGLWGHVIRRVGAFSVVRGTADRASFRMTRQLLGTVPGAKLVIFPEGEVYSQNDTLLPFHSGIFQLAFWALEDRRKAEQSDPSGPPLSDLPLGGGPLYVLPVAIKYRFVQDMTGEIRASLTRLERFVGVTDAAAAPAAAERDDYTRLREIGRAMLLSLEQEYRLPPPPPPPATNRGNLEDLTARLDAVKEAILQRVAAAAGVALPRGETLPERMRALIHVIETVTRDEPSAPTLYDTRLRHHQQERARPLLRDLERLANWIAVYDGYVRADPTPERMADTLTRLERECFGKAVIRGPRRCRIRLGQPLDLNTFWEAYRADRRACVAQITHTVETQVADLLREEASSGAESAGS